MVSLTPGWITLSLALQLGASGTTIASSWFYGNKSILGPSLALGSQVFWWWIMVHEGLWGLAPLNIVMCVLHVRNFVKWRREV